MLPAVIDELRQKLARGALEDSFHAVQQMMIRSITPEEVAEAIHVGEVIEDYPEDKYGPSCLVLGRTRAGRPIHVQCTHPSRMLVQVITAYEPAPAEWEAGFKQRK